VVSLVCITFPFHSIQLALSYVTNLTEGIILLHNNAHSHVAHRLQDQVNAQALSIQPRLRAMQISHLWITKECP